MRFESPRDTSTRLPESPPPGEIADRGSFTKTSGFCCARYTPGFRSPHCVIVSPLDQDERGSDRG